MQQFFRRIGYIPSRIAHGLRPWGDESQEVLTVIRTYHMVQEYTTHNLLPHTSYDPYKMIYICGSTSGKLIQTQEFSNRKLDGLTQGRVRDIVLFGKADYTQLAYDGYKANLEAFLLATAVKAKVSTKELHFPLPADYEPQVPLPYPPVIFKLAKKPSDADVTSLRNGLEKWGLLEVKAGKGNPSFSLDRTSFTLLRRTLPAISVPRGPSVTGYAQLEGTSEMLRVYQCVDAFLATNTYFYRKECDETVWGGVLTSPSVGELAEARLAGMVFRSGYGKGTKKVGTGPLEGPARKIDDEEPEDLTRHREYQTPIGAAVLVAKPSPKPSSTSYGAPADTPFHPGLLFPYFTGMLAADTEGFRELVSDLFFRNLGVKLIEPRQAYLAFRASIGTATTTEAGIILLHVLKGISLSLQTQTHLYLLFDSTVYLGFVLLGELFSVFAHGKWHRPLSAEALRTELRGIQTHESTLAALEQRIKRCILDDGDAVTFEEGDTRSMSMLADLLSKIKLRDAEKDEDDIAQLLARMSFSTSYKTFKPSNIAWAIMQMTDSLEEELPGDLPIYIPLRGWGNLGKKEYKVLAAFGPRGPSFRNSSGVEIKVPKPGTVDPLTLRNEAGELKFPRLLVGEKVISEALKDWADLKAKGSIKQDQQERAGGSRNHPYREKEKVVIWEALKVASANGHLAVGKGTDEVAVAKRSHEIAFGESSISELIFD
jgi:hypothetical protein